MFNETILFTGADQEVMPHKLWRAPEPQFHESAASWVQRVCGAHGYSMTRMRKILILKNDKNKLDWDLVLLSSNWSRLADMAGLEQGAFRRQARSMRWLCQLFSTQDWMHTTKGRPISTWCPQCLAEDQIPYLRWYWRHRAYERCIVHDMKMERCCAFCESPYWVDRAILVATGKCMGVLNLSYCGSCGSSLAAQRNCNELGDRAVPIRLPIQRTLQQLHRVRLLDIANSMLETMDRKESNFMHIVRLREVANMLEQRPVMREKIKSFGMSRPFVLLRHGVSALDQNERGEA